MQDTQQTDRQDGPDTAEKRRGGGGKPYCVVSLADTGTRPVTVTSFFLVGVGHGTDMRLKVESRIRIVGSSFATRLSIALLFPHTTLGEKNPSEK